MKVRSTMTRNVISIAPDDTIDEAYDLMKEYEIRHLPVTEGTKLVGIISERDILLRANLEEGRVLVPEIPAYDVMTTDVATCTPRSSISDVAATMVDNKIGCLPVVQNNELVGVVTTSDLLDILCQWKEGVGQQTLPFEFELHQYAGRENHPRPWAQ